MRWKLKTGFTVEIGSSLETFEHTKYDGEEVKDKEKKERTI